MLIRIRNISEACFTTSDIIHRSNLSIKLTALLESDLILYFGIFMNILHLALVTLFVLVVTRHPFPYRFFMLFLQAE